jgi:hypothetical protein
MSDWQQAIVGIIVAEALLVLFVVLIAAYGGWSE